jgi:SM-20-related protein
MEATTPTVTLPRLTKTHLETLIREKFVVIPDFISTQLQNDLRTDVNALREDALFNVAKIGQDNTNTLNTNVRVAETCFLGPGRYTPNSARDNLYSLIEQLRLDLCAHTNVPLDTTLTELLYAYYPQGGYYRKHTDALQGSASALREYSLLLYLNDADWADTDGGQLRLYLSPQNAVETDETPILDVLPKGGTLALFRSDCIPHEVLDTQRERCAVIGWYNRPLQGLTDVSQIAGPRQLVGLAVAFGLVTVGVIQLLMASQS